MAEMERWCGSLEDGKVLDLKHGERDGDVGIMVVVMAIFGVCCVSKDVYFYVFVIYMYTNM